MDLPTEPASTSATTLLPGFDRRRVRPTLPAWLLAGASGLLCALAFPRWEGLYLEPLAWWGLVPLLVALERRESPWWCCIAYAFAYQLAQLWVLIGLLGAGVGLLMLNAAGVWLVPAAYLVLRRVLPRVPALAVWVPASVVLEWLQATHLATNAPWWVLGASQARALPATQMIHATGVWGLSAWLFALNAAVFAAWTARTHRFKHAVVTLFVGLAPWAYGMWRLQDPGARGDANAQRSVHVAAIGSGLPPAGQDRIPLAKLASREALLRHADLVVWPEGVNVPGMPDTPSMRDPLLKSVLEWDRPLLIVGTRFQLYGNEAPAPPFALQTGAAYEAQTGSVWLTPEQARARHQGSVRGASEPAFYAKRHLVPFQETLPGAQVLPALAAQLHRFAQHGRSHWFTPGEPHDGPLPAIRTRSGAETTLAPLVCFEALFPAEAARRVRQGAQLLIWQTNDEDAGSSFYAYQFAQFARLRAVETQRDVVRVNTDGDHMHVDAFGRVVERTARSSLPSHAVFSATPRSSTPLAVKAPHAFLALCAGGAAGLMALFVLSGGRRAQSPLPRHERA